MRPYSVGNHTMPPDGYCEPHGTRLDNPAPLCIRSGDGFTCTVHGGFMGGRWDKCDRRFNTKKGNQNDQ